MKTKIALALVFAIAALVFLSGCCEMITGKEEDYCRFTRTYEVSRNECYIREHELYYQGGYFIGCGETREACGITLTCSCSEADNASWFERLDDYNPP